MSSTAPEHFGDAPVSRQTWIHPSRGLPARTIAALALGGALVLGAPVTVFSQSPLGSAQQFGVLGSSTVTNTGATTITGNLGVSPGTAVTGFPPGTVTGTIHPGDATAAQARTDATNAYNGFAALPSTMNLTGQDLGSDSSLAHPLTPGVYSFSSSAQLTGSLFLDFAGSNNARFVFQIGSTLTTASGSSVFVTNPASNDGIFFQVGSSAVLGTTTAFQGNVIALTSVTLNSGANIACGRAIALNGAVTLDNNTISNDCSEATIGSGGSSGGTTTTPEPSSFVLLGSGLVGVIPIARRRRS